MARMACPAFAGPLILLWAANVIQATQPCPFNRLCTCSPPSNPLPEVFCYNVPLTRLPNNLPSGHLYRLNIVGSKEIFTLEERCTGNNTVSSLTITHSNLYEVDGGAFAGTEHTLTTLDLSWNRLKSYPSLPLDQLPLLQWLSLKGNRIEELKRHDLAAHSHSRSIEMRTLLLSDNRLSLIQDQLFTAFKKLQSLDLAANVLTKIEGRPFPSSLSSLSLSQNLLDAVPVKALANLESLKWLQLRGNLINELPNGWFLPVKQIEILDLSHNAISSLAADCFIIGMEGHADGQVASYGKLIMNVDIKLADKQNESNESSVDTNPPPVSIRDLLLDFNFLQTLPSGLFRNVSVQRLSLSNNRLATLPPELFAGPLESQLRALDLNFNALAKYPEALKILKRLSSLFLRGNRLGKVDDDAFTAHKDHLQSLDLSSNLLQRVPGHALHETTRLMRLNLQDNLIVTIDEQDFGRWASTLLSLSLSKNNLQVIMADAFKHAKNLRELRLSYNSILSASSNVLLPLRQSLEVLELSYAIGSVSSRVIQSVSFLDRLEWLELDHNRLRSVPISALHGLPSLLHCDLDGNDMAEIPEKFFSSTVHSKLRNIILSDNKLRRIAKETFVGLPQLVNIVASGNRIECIEEHAFKDLPSLNTVILARNGLKKIESSAFSNVSHLTNVFLQENKLKEFSLKMFQRPKNDPVSMSVYRNEGEDGEDDSGEQTQSQPERGVSYMYINVSHNEISELVAVVEEEEEEEGEEEEREGEGAKVLVTSSPSSFRVRVRVLDVSHNRLSRLVPVDFMSNICNHLESLYMSHNKLTQIPIWSLRACASLTQLLLNNNRISELQERPVKEKETVTQTQTLPSLDQLQILNLADNRINNITAIKAIFPGMANLKVLDLAGNDLTTIDSDTFGGMILEKLVLARNKLVHLASDHESDANCLMLTSTLKYLDISHNYFAKMPSQVNGCERLSQLLMGDNQMRRLEDGSFRGLDQLHELRISNNDLKMLSTATFHPLARLRVLEMNNCTLTALPSMALGKLIHLMVAKNFISNVSSQAFAKSRQIKQLDLSHNNLTDVPRALWRYVPGLLDLKVAFNPIEVLDTSSLSALPKLRHLDISGLALKFVDSRMLHSLRHLISVKTSTYPTVRSFRLHDLFAKSTSLRSALIEVQEATLSHQIQWAFGAKLKELIITGPNLVNILPDAFLGLYHGTDLILRITETNVTDLPAGLLRYLSNRFALIDLRKNKLRTLNSDVLQFQSAAHGNALATVNSPKAWTSFQVAGGLLLDDNPWICTCDLLWLSSWQRRWLRETRKLNMLNFDVFLHQDYAPLQGQCSMFVSNVISDRSHLKSSEAESTNYANDRRSIALIDLFAETMACSLSTSIHFLELAPHLLAASLFIFYSFAVS